jgi:maleylacetoacetate isomerase
MAHTLKLYSYWRSSASYRVRIALNLKALSYETVPVNLLAQEHLSEEFAGTNPQQMVPVLLHGGRAIRQSLAIIEWLEESFEAHGVALLPSTPRERARVRGISHMIAADIAPLNVPRVLNKLTQDFGADETYRKSWMQHWMRDGFTRLEQLLDNASTGDFCEGDEPTMADCCLIPQTYNAVRWGLQLSEFPTIQRIYANALAMQEFADAAPEKQVDAT